MLLVKIFRQVALHQGLLAVPNARSSHTLPTPLGGGIVFMTLWCLSVVLAYFLEILSFYQVSLFLPGTIIVAMVGFLDDKKEMKAKWRLFVQLLMASFFVFLLPPFSELHVFSDTPFYLGVLTLPLTILGIAWSVNLFNFMDGLDGLSGVEGLFVMGVGGFLFWNAGGLEMALLAWSLALFIIGFLVWNWPKASIFMGGVGSYGLGFLIAVFSLVGEVFYRIPIGIWIILYGVFWFDATVTLFRRIFYKENFTKAHKKHAFQRLNQAGYSHQQVLFCVIGLNTLLAGIAIWVTLEPSFMLWGFLLMILILTLSYLKVEQLKPMQKTQFNVPARV